MYEEQRSQIEVCIPGTPTSVHLRRYTVNLQMREFLIHGTNIITSMEEGEEQWLIRKKTSTNEQK